MRFFNKRLLSFERFSNALRCSFSGLKRAFQNETACQQELFLLFALTPIIIFLDIGYVDKILLISSLLIVLIVEILNTSIEAIVDLVSPDHNDLAGYAKDLGSAAVLMSLILAFVIWGVILCRRYVF